MTHPQRETLLYVAPPSVAVGAGGGARERGLGPEARVSGARLPPPDLGLDLGLGLGVVVGDGAALVAHREAETAQRAEDGGHAAHVGAAAAPQRLSPSAEPPRTPSLARANVRDRARVIRSRIANAFFVVGSGSAVSCGNF